MLSLSKIFNTTYPIQNTIQVLSAIETLSMQFTDNYIKDHDAKDAAIDSICEYLQSIKTNKQQK